MKMDWRQGILYITVLGMEGCWLYALITMFNGQVADGRLSILGLLLIYPLSFGFNWLIQRLLWKKVYIHGLSWLVWLLAMLVTVKIQLFLNMPLSDLAWILAVPRAIGEVINNFNPALMILITTAVIWWLGQRLAHLKVNFMVLVSEFQFGFVILAFTFLFAYLLRVEIGHPVYLTLFFFVFALTGASVAHAMEGTSWLSGLYQGQWLGLLLLSISLVIIVGLIISSLITPDLLQLGLAVLNWVWGLILKMITFIVSLIPQPEPQPPMEIPSMGPMPGAGQKETFTWSMPEAVRSSLRIMVGVLFVGMVLVALWQVSSQIFAWLRRRMASVAGAEYEPLPSTFIADFLRLIRRVLIKLFEFRLLFRIRRKPRSISPAALSIRQIYRQLLRWAADRGYPRHISQTPQEYFNRLAGLLPERRGDLDLITRQYIGVRYGVSLPTRDELDQVSQSWHKIRHNRLKHAGEVQDME
jgi:hypothetical protein